MDNHKQHKQNKFNNLTYNKMLNKLSEMYSEEQHLINEGNKLKQQYEQLQDDKELLQTMIMYSANKQGRTQ
jgi:hypothetical protein